MNAGPHGHNPKWHAPAPTRQQADVRQTQMDQTAHAQSIQTGTQGDMKNLPGQRSVQFLTNDYGVQRHESYESQLAQPAYSGHGKVRVGSTSDL